jgi:hypothetical protein
MTESAPSARLIVLGARNCGVVDEKEEKERLSYHSVVKIKRGQATDPPRGST